MKRFHIIKKASPVNYALESSRTLDNGVVLKLIHCGETLTVSARKYSGVDAADLPMLTA